VKDSTLLDDEGKSIGKGLFTTVDIPAPVSQRDGDEVKIIEMTGPPRPLTHVDPDNQYLIKAEGHLIDMKNPSDSSVGRYSNECHPEDEEKGICDNNAETITFDEGVWLCASEAIARGEEIMWDYGAFYWDDMGDRKHDAPDERGKNKKKRDEEAAAYKKKRDRLDLIQEGYAYKTSTKKKKKKTKSTRSQRREDERRRERREGAA
jgi:hypothetical protein